MQNHYRDIHLLFRLIAMRFVQDHCAQTAASLAFTTVLSLVPMITIALTVFSAFPAFDDFSAQIKIYLLNNLVPESAGIIISQYMQQFADSAARLTAFGIVFLAVTALSMMLTIDDAFNIIWRVNRPRPLFKRLVAYWAVLTLAPLLIGASLSLTSWLVGLSMGRGEDISSVGYAVLKILPILFTTLAFTLLFQLVPNRYVPLTHALIGALVAALLFETTNRIFGYFISHFPTYKLVYGAFASVPIFLMWIYLSWLTILLGAIITASLSHWRTSALQNAAPGIQLLNAMRILQILVNGLHKGNTSSLPGLSKSLRLGYDILEEILERLASVDLVRKVQGNGWVLMRDADHIHVTELLRLFVLDRNALPHSGKADPLLNWLSECAGQLEKNAHITLQELFSQEATSLLARAD